jgi:hypothetical protein
LNRAIGQRNNVTDQLIGGTVQSANGSGNRRAIDLGSSSPNTIITALRIKSVAVVATEWAATSLSPARPTNRGGESFGNLHFLRTRQARDSRE